MLQILREDVTEDGYQDRCNTHLDQSAERTQRKDARAHLAAPGKDQSYYLMVTMRWFGLAGP